MKIIRRGKVQTEEKRFECQNCGCEFIADEHDKKIDVMGDYVICPTCEQYIAWDW